MNLLYTKTGDPVTYEALYRATAWRSKHHIVEEMPIHRVASYLRLNPASSLALVDAIVCAADSPLFTMRSDGSGDGFEHNYPLERALLLAERVRSLPQRCAMRDGRQWKSIPFIIFPSVQFEMLEWAREHTHATILPPVANRHPLIGLRYVEQICNEFQDRVLSDYASFGILVRFVNGHVQVLPALRKINPSVQSEYYYTPADRRGSGWVTVRRDNQGLRHDIELFQQLIDHNGTEQQIQKFFEEHPAFLMQARNGIPIPHQPNFANPANNRPDFALTPILGPVNDKSVELLELKLPGVRTLTKGLHRGFSAKVTGAINQVRDYARNLRDPGNFERVLQALGYLPDRSKLAVLIGRRPRNDADQDVWNRRQDEIDVSIVTYDEILQTQADQLI